jgi:hypothetical protein
MPAGMMQWSRCRICTEVVHQWGVWWPTWKHEREAKPGLTHPDGYRTFDHRAKPQNWTTGFIGSPRIADPGPVADVLAALEEEPND